VRAPIAITALLAGCIVTRPPRIDERPRWRLVTPASYVATCALADAWIRKTGKQGIGIALRLRSRGDCTFAIASAHLLVDGKPTGAGSLAPITLPGRSQLYAWLPVRFDNNALWNDDRDDATLELDVVVAGLRAPTWRIPVHQQ
jgi:hypothetical protein